MTTTYEVNQATGSNAQIIYGAEGATSALWGNPPGAADNVFKELGIVSESLDDNVAVYGSNTIRKNRTRNQSVRGTRRPAGSISMELAATGPVTYLLYCLLGGAPTTSSGVGTGTTNHVFKGSTSSVLPSFTMEKGFLDLTTPKYQAYTGCRVGSGSFDFSVDNMVTANFEIMNRLAQGFVTTSVAGTSVVTKAPINRPFTSVEIALSLGGTAIATAKTLKLDINNSLFGDTGFVLGSPYRQNLKAGKRVTGGSATFLFDSTTYYDLAYAGTLSQLVITCTDVLGYYVKFRMPQVQLLPNNTSPKITNDGPIEISANFEAVQDDTLNSEIECTIENVDSDITN